jgi:hypothetical protein
MNGPDTAGGGRIPKTSTEYRRRIKSSAFFRERNSRGLDDSDNHFAHYFRRQMPVKTGPLSSFGTESIKLMQEIHRLTDN